MHDKHIYGSCVLCKACIIYITRGLTGRDDDESPLLSRYDNRYYFPLATQCWTHVAAMSNRGIDVDPKCVQHFVQSRLRILSDIEKKQQK